MKIIELFKKGHISKQELLSEAAVDPELKSKLTTLVGAPIDEESLEAIAAAGDITGTNEHDFLIGGGEADTIEGLGGGDTLYGGDGDDTILGGEGLDVIYGGTGDDVIDGGTGNDILDGGAGADTFTFQAGDGQDSINNFGPDEDVIELHGINSDEFTIEYDSTSGDSIITYDGGTIKVVGQTISASDIRCILDGDGASNTLEGGAGSDILDGGAGSDVLNGGQGDDTITGGEGADTFVFKEGDGDDTISDFNPEQDNIQLNGPYSTSYDEKSGNTIITYEGGTITLEGVNALESDFTITGGTDGDDTMAGGDQGDTMNGGSGNDNMSGGGGDDTMDGGSGDDNMSGGDGDDTMNGGDGDDTMDGGDGKDMLIGGSGNNTLHGGGGDDYLKTKDGNDTLDGGSGDDVLDGGQGDDILTGGEGRDTFIIQSRSEGTDTITDYTPGEDKIVLNGLNGPNNYTITYDPQTGNSTVTWGKSVVIVEGQQITDDDIQYYAGKNGTDGDDFLMGGSYAKGTTLDGGAGNDTIEGLFEDDTLSGGSGDDTIQGGHGNDLIDGGTGDDTIAGDIGDDTLTGGEGADTFTFRLGDGNDTITDFTPGEDTIQLPDNYNMTYDPGTGNTTIYYAGGTITVEGAEVSPEDIEIHAEGSDGFDFISGGAGDDVINGGQSSDTLIGGGGDDTFAFGPNGGSDTILDFTQGEDKIQLPGNYDMSYDPSTGTTTITYEGGTITVHGVELTSGDITVDYEGTGSGDTFTGERGDDTISGGYGNDDLSGGRGNDVVDGGHGDDTLYGGFGSDGDDVLTGGQGSDVFVFGSNQGNDTITDFHPEEDNLELIGAEASDDISVEIVNGNTVITFGDSTITLEGVSMTLEEVWARAV